MWGLGAIRDGAAGLVKQGAGAVKQGVEAGAKLLENLDEVGETARSSQGVLLFLRGVPPSPMFRLPRCGFSLGDEHEWWEGRLLHWLTPLKCSGSLFIPSFFVLSC